MRLPRNAITHDYLLESADRVLAESLTAAPELLAAVESVSASVTAQGYGR